MARQTTIKIFFFCLNVWVDMFIYFI